MAVPAFLAAKLAGFVFSKVSTPISAKAKAKAKTSPFFRNYIILPPAQFYMFCEERMRQLSTQMGTKPLNIPKMTEAGAIELGAELVGEIVIFTIAAVMFLAEYVRSTRKERAKEEARKKELRRVHAELKDLYYSKAKLEAEVKELIRVLHVSVKVSKDSFNPEIPNFDSIPEHHRGEGDSKEEKKGFFSSISSYVSESMEVLFPPEDEEALGKAKKKTSSTDSTTDYPSKSGE